MVFDNENQCKYLITLNMQQFTEEWMNDCMIQ